MKIETDAMRVFALATLFLAMACGSKEEVVEAAPVPIAVKTLEITDETAGRVREYAGQTAAWQHNEMAFEVPGKIIDFRVVEGDRVEKGAMLASLDPRDFEAGLKAAQATLAQARADYERYQLLFKEGVSPKADLEAKRERFEVAEAEVGTAEKALEDASLVAAFDGVIARKLVEDFENVRAKQPVLILQDNSRLKIRVTVPEADMSGERRHDTSLDALNEQLSPQVVVTSLRYRTFPAELQQLALTADPVTRTFEATFVMDSPEDVNVLAGMTAKVIIQVPDSESGGPSIPGVAVFSNEGDEALVWKVDKATNTVSATPVTLGALSGDRVQITAGLKKGDMIATSGIHALADGDTIHPLGERLR